MASTLCRSSSMPLLWRLMSSNSKPAVVKVAGKELKIINDVTAVPNSQIFEKESTKTHLAQISKIESDISPKDMYTISGMPKEHIFSRRVRIYKEAKNAMQSGTKNTHTWKMEFENRERWENPLMGWTSTGDPVSNLTVKFNNIDEAIAFCEKNNWFYAVEDIPPERKPRKKSYADNFSWNKRTRVGSK